MIPPYLPNRRFSVHVRPAGSVVMAALTGYFDDSGEDEGGHSCVVIAGFVADLDSWHVFEPAWQAALDKAEVPYMHMREIMDPNSPLGKFAGKENEAARKNFFIDLIRAVRDANLWAFGALVRLDDLKRFNTDHQQNLQSIPLALYGCMTEVTAKEPPSTVEIVLDKIDKPESRIAIAMEYAATDPKGDIGEALKVLPLKRTDSFKDVLGIQAADFLAWEVRKQHECMTLWWETGNRGNSPVEAALSQIEWLRRKSGKKWPNQRRSYAGLAHAAYPNGGVWDYRVLCAEDTARNGVWRHNLECGA
jgi:hypothetical protein